MFYSVNIENGYIHGVVKGVSEENSNITEEEYGRIKNLITNCPMAPEDYFYRLKDNLEWELCEITIE